MKRRSVKIAVLALALTVCLAALGAGYAMWSDTLTISGTVSTGTLDVDLGLYGQYISENDHGKDVGNCRAWLDADLDDVVNIEVTNGYPSYECWVTLYVGNMGTIPVHLHRPVLENPYPNEVTVEIATVGPTGLDAYCYGQDEQLHSDWSQSCDIYIHVEQPALQSDDPDYTGPYTFTGSILAHQFNEEP